MNAKLKKGLYVLLILITGHVVAADLTTTQVIGHYDKYNLYRMMDQDLSGDLGYNVDGQTQVSAIEIAKRLAPVNPVEASKVGITCDFLCETPIHQVVGYDPAVLAMFKKLAAKHH